MNFGIDSRDPLCCCEYFDVNHERSHILACCCNCIDLDEAFESLITRKGVSQNRLHRIMVTLQDRLRIPWGGGARQVKLDSILPIFILPLMLCFTSINLWCTIIGFFAMALLLVYVHTRWSDYEPRNRFLLMWMITSVVFITLEFEFIVVPFLKILVHENVAIIALTTGFVCCIILVRARQKELKFVLDSHLEAGNSNKISTNRLYNCNICRIAVPERDYHCAWADCCIGYHNKFFYALALVLAPGWLLYSGNLTVTSICHPFHFYKTILLPDDCSDVYQQFELSLSFVTALYSVGISIVLLMLFLHEVLLISSGLCGQEWFKLPWTKKLLYGFTTERPNSLGFFHNWFRVIWCCHDDYIQY